MSGECDTRKIKDRESRAKNQYVHTNTHTYNEWSPASIVIAVCQTNINAFLPKIPIIYVRVIIKYHSSIAITMIVYVFCICSFCFVMFVMLFFVSCQYIYIWYSFFLFCHLDSFSRSWKKLLDCRYTSALNFFFFYSNTPSNHSM